MLQKFWQLPQNKWYWITFIILGVALESVALFYQYILEYSPCVLCIHTRIWVMALILVSLLGLASRQYLAGVRFAQLSMFAVSLGLLDRSWQLLGVERGFIMGGCSMDSGLPAWFALDKWFPAMFEVMEPCGYTPELPFGVTMAEALLVFSAVMVIFHGLLFISTLVRK